MFRSKKRSVPVPPTLPVQAKELNPGANGIETSEAAYTVLKKQPNSGVHSPSSNVMEGVNSDRFVLVGSGTQISGEINNCAVVEVQGQFEGNISADQIIIREGGSITGSASTKNAEVHGVLQGEITVTNLLDIHSTGQVDGELVYGQLSVSAGGYIGGNLRHESITDGVQSQGQDTLGVGVPSSRSAATISGPGNALQQQANHHDNPVGQAQSLSSQLSSSALKSQSTERPVNGTNGAANPRH